MWERFGYYLMIGIFLLYLKNVEQGFAMTNTEASDLYGTFIALVFLQGIAMAFRSILVLAGREQLLPPKYRYQQES